MKFHVLIMSACMLLLGACAVYPVQTTPDTDVAAADVGNNLADAIAVTIEQADYADDDRIICKRTIITGSRFKRQVCMTWFEWKETNLRGKDYINDIQSEATQLDNS